MFAWIFGLMVLKWYLHYVVHYKFRHHHYLSVIGLNTACIDTQQLWPHEYVLWHFSEYYYKAQVTQVIPFLSNSLSTQPFTITCLHLAWQRYLCIPTSFCQLKVFWCWLFDPTGPDYCHITQVLLCLYLLQLLSWQMISLWHLFPKSLFYKNLPFFYCWGIYHDKQIWK